MAATVSSFARFRRGDYEYLFLVVSRYGYRREVSAELRRLGQAMRSKGIVLEPFREAAFQTLWEVRNKKWPQELQSKLGRLDDPFI